MRYVVRNDFFGLENRPQNQQRINDKPAAAIKTGEHEGRREKRSEEHRGVPRPASLVGSQEDLETSQDQGLQREHICSELSKDPVDSVAGTEKVAGDFIQNGVETAAKDCNSPDKTTSNLYDDEIWESPGAVM